MTKDHGWTANRLGTRALMLVEWSPVQAQSQWGKMEREGLTKLAEPTGRKYERIRRFPRHRFDSRIQASVFREGQTTTCWGRASELGQDGMGATLSGELQIGEVVSLEFSIPVAPHSMKVRAVVRYSKGLRCGFEFLVVPDKQKPILREVCAILANPT